MPRTPLLALMVAMSLAASPVHADRILDGANRDTTCAPCQDFDRFANGGWRSRFVIPAAYSRYGAFTEVADRNQKVLLEIVTRAEKAKPKSQTDEARLAARGVELHGELRGHYVGQLRRVPLDAFGDVDAEQD